MQTTSEVGLECNYAVSIITIATNNEYYEKNKQNNYNKVNNEIR